MEIVVSKWTTTPQSPFGAGILSVVMQNPICPIHFPDGTRSGWFGHYYEAVFTSRSGFRTIERASADWNKIRSWMATQELGQPCLIEYREPFL